ncbi:MAG: ABC transporter permease [Armatimonadetes bacterium]|nr:ABC transporter permease [Armatimonadota bacterium]
MTLLSAIGVALDTLRANKLRSALTMLGVIIGVMAVVIMVSLIEGARANVVKEFEQLGSDVIMVSYEPWRQGQFVGGSVAAMTSEDASAIRELPNIRMVCSMVQAATPEITYEGRSVQPQFQGVEESYFEIRGYEIAKGRAISTMDIEEGAKVIVIGEEVRSKLFPQEEAIGKDLLLSGMQMRVIGVLAKKGRGMGDNLDNVIIAPVTAVQSRWNGNREVDMIYVVPESREKSGEAMEAIWEKLMRRHDNQAVFRVDSFESILNAISRIISLFGALIGSIAGLALLVGGIGIMNIMLVSVTERTKEIGLRKALGAKRPTILTQFLVEAATLSGIGGALGIFMGWSLGLLVQWGSRQVGAFGDNGLPIYFPVWAAIVAFVFSLSVGVVFGIYPAIRASKLDPIEALRRE